jgi:hypothetical protein
MSTQSRDAKVLAALLTSITATVIILMALGNNPPPAGAFCLSRYYHLSPIEKVISARSAQFSQSWDRIEIYYCGTQTDKVEQPPSVTGRAAGEHIQCHFVVCNGIAGYDGQIQPTEKWQKQCSIIPASHPQAVLEAATNHTIHICVTADSKTSRPSDVQIKRVEALVEALHRKFNIEPEAICYPEDWP